MHERRPEHKPRRRWITRKSRGSLQSPLKVMYSTQVEWLSHGCGFLDLRNICSARLETLLVIFYSLLRRQKTPKVARNAANLSEDMLRISRKRHPRANPTGDEYNSHNGLCKDARILLVTWRRLDKVYIPKAMNSAYCVTKHAILDNDSLASPDSRKR
jgi:hypothetical protein